MPMLLETLFDETADLAQHSENNGPIVTEAQVTEALKMIYDPEIPNANIVDLGLIYQIVIERGTEVYIAMTLTSPMCPVAQTFPQTVEDKVIMLPGVESVKVELVWDPPWSSDNLSESTKLELGLL
jgi:FeS assembly SUF system protein